MSEERPTPRVIEGIKKGIRRKKSGRYGRHLFLENTGFQILAPVAASDS